MRTFPNLPCKRGDVIVTRGLNGGVISTVTVTDARAQGKCAGTGGYACRDATAAEIRQAQAEDMIIDTVGWPCFQGEKPGCNRSVNNAEPARNSGESWQQEFSVALLLVGTR